MNIAEMQVMFRQYAQQMGMQNVRAILPEQIDLLINTSIADTVNQLVRENIGITNDRIITDNSKVGQINAFRSLYKVLKVNANPSSESSTITNPFGSSIEGSIYKQYADIKNLDKSGSFDYLFIVDMSLSYTINNQRSTNYFPIRLIDDIFLADTLNDFILRPRFRSPIAVIYNNTLEIYIEEKEDFAINTLPNGLKPNVFRLGYIAKPAKVYYGADLGQSNVDCDLPEYMHVDIVKHAVDLYRIAISSSLYGAQQQEQAAQQENMRNNYRNEGTGQ